MKFNLDLNINPNLNQNLNPNLNLNLNSAVPQAIFKSSVKYAHIMIEIAILAGGYLLLIMGIGLLFPWSLFRSSPSYPHLMSAFWVGFAWLIAFLQVWQIFLPVGMASFLILAAAGLCGWLISWKKVRGWLGGHSRSLTLVFLAGAGLVFLFLSNIVIYSDLSPDFGGYHLPTVIWFTSYRLPLGLVNLHYRLAFNQAGLLLPAQLESGILPGLAYYITGPLIFGALLLHTAHGVLFALRKPVEIRTWHIASAFLFFVTLKYVSQTQLAGYAPDRMIYALEVVLALEIIDLFEKPYPEQRTLGLRVVQSLLLIGLGTVVKLSFAGFGLAALLAIGASLVFTKRMKVNLRPVAVAAALAGALVIPWMVRGFIMTGYPLFPSNLVSFPVAWRMPVNDANQMVSIITDWARTCSNTMPLESGKLWLLTWINCEPPEFWEILVLSALALLATILLGVGRMRKKAPGPDNTSAAVLLAVSVVSLLFWLWMAPDYRFAGAAFWLLFLSCLLLLKNQVFAFFTQAAHLRLLAAAGLVFIAWLSPNLHNFDLKKSTFFFPPPAMQVAKSHYPQGQLISQPLPGGGIVYSTTAGGSGCWDAPLPCTQINDLRQSLRMFDPNHLDDGFYVSLIKGP